MKLVNLFDHVLENVEDITNIKTKYLSLLGELTEVSYLSNKSFFKNIEQINNMGKIIIGIVEDTIVCSGTILIEPKIIRGGKSAAHIEDIVVLKKWRNKGIAKELIDTLRNIANENDCYKIILDCSDTLVPFYEKKGFSKKGIQMFEYIKI